MAVEDQVFDLLEGGENLDLFSPDESGLDKNMKTLVDFIGSSQFSEDRLGNDKLQKIVDELNMNIQLRNPEHADILGNKSLEDILELRESMNITEAFNDFTDEQVGYISNILGPAQE